VKEEKMSENKEEKPKPGTFRIAIAALILFAVITVPLIAKYVWQASVDQNLINLISVIIGGLVGNIDRIFSAFFPKKGE
jgi:lipoprotein signal peptidase